MKLDVVLYCVVTLWFLYPPKFDGLTKESKIFFLILPFLCLRLTSVFAEHGLHLNQVCENASKEILLYYCILVI